jgi:hypothetical protein
MAAFHAIAHADPVVIFWPLIVSAGTAVPLGPAGAAEIGCLIVIHGVVL